MKFTIYTKYDPFVHHVYDLDSLEDIIYGLTDNEEEAKRIVSIAKRMVPYDCFGTYGVMIACDKEQSE